MLKIFGMGVKLDLTHRPSVFKNRVPRRIFGPKREKVKVTRKLHNEELHDRTSHNILSK